MHDEIDFDQVCQISMRVGSSPELPVYNNLTQADLSAYAMMDWLNKKLFITLIKKKK